MKRFSVLVFVAALAMMACEQGPAPATPASTGAPAAAAQPGIRSETIVIAIKADRSARSTGNAAVQVGSSPNVTLQFPADFAAGTRHRTGPLSFEFDFLKHLPHASITRRVIEKGGIVPWVSLNGGTSWHAGGFDLGGQVKLSFEYRAGDAEDDDTGGTVTIKIAALGLTPGVESAPQASLPHAISLVRNYLAANNLLIRFFIITDQ